MSDLMRSLPGGTPGGAPGGALGGAPGGRAGAMGAVERNRSAMNPTDLATMAGRGGMKPGMTIRDFLGQFGVDVDGPVEQLQQFMKKQVENAGGVSKMQNIAGAAPGGQPTGRPPMTGRPQPMAPSQGIQNFMGGMR